MRANRCIRILIIEDGRLHARLLTHALAQHDDLQVVGVARDGHEALRLIAELEPDLVTMDVRMPNMDGYEATLAIMSTRPLPILVVAELSSRHDTTALQMLGAGALDIFLKPHGLQQWAEASARLAQRIRILARVRVNARIASPASVAAPSAPQGSPSEPSTRPQIIALVASTGGPHALLHILQKLPADLPIPLVFVQHITAGFGSGLARWLGQNCALDVQWVDHEIKLLAPGAFMAPDGHHLIVGMSATEPAVPVLSLTDGDPIGSLRPRGDVLLSSVARVFGPHAVGIVLTGMGDDGARGLAEMRRCGALTIAQDQASATIYGMPKVAVEIGAAAHVLSLDAIAERILALGKQR